MRTIIVGLLISLISFNVSATDFQFETTYWFKKITAECRGNMCKVDVNKKFYGEFPYTVEDDKAILENEEASVTIDLKKGDFKWELK